MQPAADAMAQALARSRSARRRRPLVANVVARAIADRKIARRLVEQVTGTVRWRNSSPTWPGEGVTRFYEIGAPRKVLSGLVWRIAPRRRDPQPRSGTPQDIDTFKAMQMA